MFHRVKSEGQDQQPIQAGRPAEPRQENRVEVSPFRPVQNNQPLAVRAESETQPQRQPQKQNEAKDNQTMSEQDTHQNEQTAASEDRELPPMSSYQRVGQAPVRTAAAVGAYPGAYPGYGVRPQQTEQQNAAQSSDRRLTIGAGITLSGEIESCDYLLVEGTVEAALKGANVLDIAESGVFYGTVEIGEANIAGRFEGDISVQGRLTISATGTVTGSISYKELEIEAGAVIDGRVTPLSAVASAAKKPSAAKPKQGKDARAENQPASPAMSAEGELFGKVAAAE